MMKGGECSEESSENQSLQQPSSKRHENDEKPDFIYRLSVLKVCFVMGTLWVPFPYDREVV